MKKVLAFVLVLLMSVALVACDDNKATSSKPAGTTSKTTSTATSEATSTATSIADESEDESEPAVESEADESPAVSA